MTTKTMIYAVPQEDRMDFLATLSPERLFAESDEIAGQAALDDDTPQVLLATVLNGLAEILMAQTLDKSKAVATELIGHILSLAPDFSTHRECMEELSRRHK